MYKNKHNHQKAIESKAQCVKEHRIAALLNAQFQTNRAEKADLIGNPSADNGQSCDRSTGSINKKSEFLTTDTKAVGDRLHH